jgi:hypothetical protein
MDTEATRDLFKVKLFPKKLESGKCQVKFSVNLPMNKNLYGYMLVDPKVSLKEVVEEIKGKVNLCQWPDYLHQEGLYSIRRKKTSVPNSLIFLFNISREL